MLKELLRVFTRNEGMESDTRRARRRVQDRRRRPVLEELEGRALLSTASITNGFLVYTAKAGETNILAITQTSATSFTITDSGVNKINPQQPACSAVSANTVICDGTVFGIDVQLKDKSDTASLGVEIMLPATLSAGSGNDSIVGGTGNDSMNGSNGFDTLDGAAGNDSVIGDAHNDELHGGPGNDLVVGSNDYDTLFGDTGDDTLDGGVNNDSLVAGDGNDSVLGSGDFDTLVGGFGNDTLDGGGGNDQMYGDEGDDSLLGGPGSDHLRGGLGSDVVFGQADPDTFGDEFQPSDGCDGSPDLWDGGDGTDTGLGFKLAVGDEDTLVSINVDLRDPVC